LSSGKPNCWDQSVASFIPLPQIKAGFRIPPQPSPFNATPAPPSPLLRGPGESSSNAPKAEVIQARINRNPTIRGVADVLDNPNRNP
jgi:hypothetical protein